MNQNISKLFSFSLNDQDKDHISAIIITYKEGFHLKFSPRQHGE